MFNDGNYWHRALYGDLYRAPVEDDHIQRRRSGQPPCTHSQLMAYFDEQGRQVAIVHEFRRPDGSLGADGSRTEGTTPGWRSLHPGRLA